MRPPYYIKPITDYIEGYFISYKFTDYEIIEALKQLKYYCDKNIKDMREP